MPISIQVKNNQTSFKPGDKVEGSIIWDLPKEPKEITVNLFWATDGKGSQDIEVVDFRKFQAYCKTGNDSFSFTLPIAPYSFSGNLISISWTLEAFAKSGRDNCQYELIMAPQGEEICQ